MTLLQLASDSYTCNFIYKCIEILIFLPIFVSAEVGCSTISGSSNIPSSQSSSGTAASALPSSSSTPGGKFPIASEMLNYCL